MKELDISILKVPPQNLEAESPPHLENAAINPVLEPGGLVSTRRPPEDLCGSWSFRPQPAIDHHAEYLQGTKRLVPWAAPCTSPALDNVPGSQHRHYARIVKHRS
jgi:hypothetical protein